MMISFSFRFWMRLLNILIFSLSGMHIAYAQQVKDTAIVVGTEDSLGIASVDSTSVKKKKYGGYYQWRVGTDLARIGFNFINPGKMGYDFQVDFKDRDKIYWTAEAGYGRGKIDYEQLKYTTHTTYLKVGLDNAMLKPGGEKDFDIVFLGVRYAAAYGNRSDATYSFDSPFGGVYEGVQEGQNFFVHWGEITLGMKLEVWKRVFMGWTARGKFLFNPGVFKEISPNYIAGYGSADNATSFDINLYLSYALIRYQKQ